jgi:hypothetical protein
MSYTDLYPLEEVSRTIGECRQIKAYHKNTIKRLLGTKRMEKPLLSSSVPVSSLPPLTRDLSIYREVIHE